MSFDNFKIQFEKVVEITKSDNFKEDLEILNLRNLCDSSVNQKEINFQILVAVILNSHTCENDDLIVSMVK